MRVKRILLAPPRRRQKAALAAAPAAPVFDPADRISRLPEEIQAHILSFLPAQEAVRTCVLARTWRHVWKFTTRLLITGKFVHEVRMESVDRLLRIRCDGLELAPLEASEIRFDPWVLVEDRDEAYRSFSRCGPIFSSINRWIDHVLKCKIQMLRVDISAQSEGNFYLQMTQTPLLISQHLIRLELTGAWLLSDCINLDGCPVLEHLEVRECCLADVRMITSLSLKCLVIASCESMEDSHRIRICVPRLLSLLIDRNTGDLRTPRLERMPDLVEAKVHIDSYMDTCHCDDPMVCYHVMRDGDTSDSDTKADYAQQSITKCVVLEGLAQARDLVLVNDGPTYIFRRDLRWCPTFSKLKTLVLTQVIYQHEPDDCTVLECLLEHAPLLEKLTLTYEKWHRDKGKYKVQMKGYPDAKVTSTKMQHHLQIVKINCEGFSERILSILSFLCTLNICFETRVTKK